MTQPLPPNVLLLADGEMAAELSHRIGRRCACVADPYEALGKLAAGEWQTVVLALPRAETESLAKASRRLGKAARIVAVCSPAAEPEVRALPPSLLDDYFIYPPTDADVEAIREPCRTAAGPIAESLPTAAITQLVAATRNVPALQGCLAQMLSPHLGGLPRWEPLEGMEPYLAPMLVMDVEPPVGLVAADPAQAAPPAMLRQLAELLPALTHAARRAELLHQLAVTDHLTGAYNRRYFYHLTEQILERARNEGFRVTLLLFDVDDLKHYNHTYGYPAGDELIRETAAMMKSIVRSHDVVARIGGDEFAVLFWDAQPPRSPDSQPPETPLVLADRFRRAVASHEFPSLGPEARGVVTVSGGLAQFPRDGNDVRELLRAADRYIKTAKRGGKNAIKLAGAPAAE